MAMDFLAIALAELARYFRGDGLNTWIDPDVSGLPDFLVKEGGLNSGFMIAQVTAVALVSGKIKFSAIRPVLIRFRPQPIKKIMSVWAQPRRSKL